MPSQTCAPVHESSAQSSAHNLCVFATVPGCEVQVYGHHGYMLQPVESLRLSGNFMDVTNGNIAIGSQKAVPLQSQCL